MAAEHDSEIRLTDSQSYSCVTLLNLCGFHLWRMEINAQLIGVSQDLTVKLETILDPCLVTLVSPTIQPANYTLSYLIYPSLPSHFRPFPGQERALLAQPVTRWVWTPAPLVPYALIRQASFLPLSPLRPLSLHYAHNSLMPHEPKSAGI